MAALTKEKLDAIEADLATIRPTSSIVSLFRADVALLIAHARRTLDARPARATLDENCAHPAGNISADGRRCLTCGAWVA